MTAPLDLRPGWLRTELDESTGKGVRVAVVDSGWDRAIPHARVLPGVSFVDPENDFATLQSEDDQDRIGHGTACADLILRIAPGCTVTPVRTFGRKLETSVQTLCDALHWSVDEGFDVINLSLGTRLPEAMMPIYRACERAVEQGLVVVAAARGHSQGTYPAVFANVIGVYSGRFHHVCEFGLHEGSALELEGFGAPQPLLQLGGKRVPARGPSYSAAATSGIVALIRARYPGATLVEVRSVLGRIGAPNSGKRAANAHGA